MNKDKLKLKDVIPYIRSSTPIQVHLFESRDDIEGNGPTKPIMSVAAEKDCFYRKPYSVIMDSYLYVDSFDEADTTTGKYNFHGIAVGYPQIFGSRDKDLELGLIITCYMED